MGSLYKVHMVAVYVSLVGPTSDPFGSHTGMPLWVPHDSLFLLSPIFASEALSISFPLPPPMKIT